MRPWDIELKLVAPLQFDIMNNMMAGNLKLEMPITSDDVARHFWKVKFWIDSNYYEYFRYIK